MSGHTLSELRKILKAVAIISPTSFSLAGQIVNVPLAAGQPMAAASPESDLTATLSQHLYLYCFSHKFNGETPKQFPATAPDDVFTQLLIDANSSRERWDAGWQITQTLPSGQIMAQKAGVSRSLWAGEFLNHDGPGMAPRVGATISAFLAKGTKTLQPGFYIAFGENMQDEPDDWRLIRFYWNIKVDGSVELMKRLTGLLNRFLVPFRFKCVTNRESYSRVDSAVLYVNRRFHRITSEIVSDVYKKMKGSMSQDTPLFTRRLAAGLALAEDPGKQDSFGSNRCRVLAEAIVNANKASAKTEQEKIDEVIKQFAHYGLDLERPYLNAGSTDVYVFPNSH